MTLIDLCQPGDCLLYASGGLYGRVIQFHTWHKESHVEVYDGFGHSWASRNGEGVGNYPFREADLAWILRPTTPLNMSAGRVWANSMQGTPYGWADLLAFVGIKHDYPGIVCSPFVTAFYRAAGWPLFPTDDVNCIAPFEFLTLVGSGFQVIYPPSTIPAP